MFVPKQILYKINFICLGGDLNLRKKGRLNGCRELGGWCKKHTYLLSDHGKLHFGKLIINFFCI